MSIVTDALNRVQAERARATPRLESGGEAESPAAPASSKSNLFTPQPPSKTIRNILRWSLIIIGVGAVGIGAYLWGLTLMPDVARVSPEHDVIPETVSEMPLDEPALSQVAETLPVQAAEEETFEAISASIGEATGSDAPETEATPGTLHNVKGNDSAKLSGEHVASLEEGPRKVLGKPTSQVIPPSPTPPTNKSSKEVAIVPHETPKPSSSGELQSPIPHSNAKSPTQSHQPPPKISRNATTVEATLIQAKYLIKKRRYQHAVTILKPLFVNPPDTWEPWFWLGTAQLGLEQFEEAEESFLEGLSRNAAIPHLWVQRALVSQQRGQYGEAVEALRQAEMIAPNLPEVQLNLAYSLEVQGEMKSAVEHYHAFLAMTEGQTSYQPARKKVLDRIIRLEKT